MTSNNALSLNELCVFMRSLGGALTVAKHRDPDGSPRLFATQLTLTINPDGYRPVSVARVATDDDRAEPECDFFALELTGIVRQIQRQHPSLVPAIIPALAAPGRESTVNTF